MIENWSNASDEEDKFARSEAGWMLAFSALACVCIVPVGLLGIWQAHDTYAVYADGISAGFIIASIVCGALAVLSLWFLRAYWREYRNIRSGIVYCSDEGRVERTWEEREGKTITKYFSFTYKDLVTGETKEYRGMNYGGKNKLQEGDALSVLAYQGEDTLEISDVFKRGERKKADASWIVFDIAILAVMFLAWAFLTLDFGAGALYVRLGINLSMIAVAAVTLVYGGLHRKLGAVAAALCLCLFMMAAGLPGSMKDISLDMAEGAKVSQASVCFLKMERTSRTRRGIRRSNHYYADVSSVETDMQRAEITGAAYQYYLGQFGNHSAYGEIIYYPNSKIFLFFRQEKKGEQK